MPNKSILFVIGTRPEAIKMAPLIKEFEKYPSHFDVDVCSTGQHREMLEQVLSFFEIEPSYQLNVMTKNQGLGELTASVVKGVSEILRQDDFDYLFVQGDTTTSFAAALAAFYEGVQVAHVEAGLRTYNKLSPYPEEVNRQLTSRIADFHFAPTEAARKNLIAEGVSDNQIWVTGNTVIDALLLGIEKLKSFTSPELEKLQTLIKREKKLILVTGHRRESFGDGFEEICKAILEISKEPDVQVVYPVHLNPNVREPVFRILGDVPNVYLIEPLDYPSFIWLMEKSYLILTDSGGIQEEAPSLGKPVLVMRDTTERMEAVEAGGARLVGTKKDTILKEMHRLLNSELEYETMAGSKNPFGDGVASRSTVNVFLNS